MNVAKILVDLANRNFEYDKNDPAWLSISSHLSNNGDFNKGSWKYSDHEKGYFCPIDGGLIWAYFVDTTNKTHNTSDDILFPHTTLKDVRISFLVYHNKKGSSRMFNSFAFNHLFDPDFGTFIDFPIVDFYVIGESEDNMIAVEKKKESILKFANESMGINDVKFNCRENICDTKRKSFTQDIRFGRDFTKGKERYTKKYVTLPI